MPKESTVIFAGTFHRTMDAKNRVTVPSDWMMPKPETFFLVPGRESVQVMPPAELARKEDQLSAMLPAGRQLQEALRVLYGSARRVEPDSQGRILVPEELCKHAALGGEVAFVGVKNRFELWNPAKMPAPSETPLSDDARNALEALGF